jgi:hypothetical protein
MYFKPKNNRRQYSGAIEPASRRMSSERANTNPSSPLCEGALHLVPANSPLLKPWKMPDEVWHLIGKRMQEQIEAVQYAGASAQASINRLDKLWIESGGKIVEEDIYADENRIALECKSPVTLQDINEADKATGTPGLTEGSSQSISQSTSRSNSIQQIQSFGLGIDTKSSSTNSAGFDDETSRMSPFELSPPASTLRSSSSGGRATRSTSEATFKLPDLSTLDISNSEYKPRRGTVSGFSPTPEGFITPARSTFVYRWRAELDYLRTDPLVTMRHGIDQICIEWEQTKREDTHQHAEFLARDSTEDYPQEKIPQSVRDYDRWTKVRSGMEQWITDKRKLVQQLTEKAEGYEGGVICRWGTTRKT